MSMSARAFLFKNDHPRQIDRYIHFFGGATSVLVGFAVAGCAELTQLSNHGGVLDRVLSQSPADVEPARSLTKAESVYTDRARDHFFTLAWRSDRTPSGLWVTGLLENRDGPALAEVTLVVSVRGANHSLLRMRALTLRDPLQKGQAQPFAVSLPSAPESSQIVVAVWSYRFDAPSGSK